MFLIGMIAGGVMALVLVAAFVFWLMREPAEFGLDHL